MEVKITLENFDEEVLHSDIPVIVDFYADWCGPCKMVAPIVEEIARENEDITVCKVNVDEDSALAVKFGIASIPTLIVFKDGREASRIIGFRPKDAILAELK